ncbi:MAG TPA: penicillin-binding transpeptidase domain-containing protein [bacterium]|nr:penicillin-binding transpeptidase domain-containing protein [bacterium]
MSDRGEPARPQGPSGPQRPQRRLFIFASLLGLIAIGLVVQLVRLAVVLPSREGGDALVLPEVQRGSILDRQGRILAVTTRMRRVSVWTPAVTAAQETATELGRALGMEPTDVLAAIQKRDGYVVIKRRVSQEEADAVQALKSDGKLAGVSVENDFSRFYPQGHLASHVVGYLGADNVPLDGVEYTFNDELAPQPVGTDSQTVYGDQVFLTIDLDVQFAVDKVARAAMEADKPDSIMILVMAARTGEILAYTALPDFDPNEFQQATPLIDPASLVNRPVTAAYEPGSVFKIFSLSSMLDQHAISPTDVFPSGFYEKKFPSGETVRIRDILPHGELVPQQIIQYSSNVGAAYASERMDADTFYRMLTRFGFGKQTGIPLQGETAGLLRPVSQWSARSKPTITFGQEVSASAIQVAAACTAIADGGVLLKPLIVSKIVSPQGTVVKEFGREPLWEVISPDSARTMLSWMETATLPTGTAHLAAVDGVRISAKTGTAQVTNAKTGAYSDSDFIASLIGIFPTDNPQFIVYVVVQNPRGQSYYGSQIAAPIFHDIAVGLADWAGLPRAGTTAAAARSQVPPASSALPVVTVGSPMPDLRGTPKKLLLPLLLRTDLSVTIDGSGYVVSQTPQPGARLDAGMKIGLELR